jgi:hypothetical protein
MKAFPKYWTAKKAEAALWRSFRNPTAKEGGVPSENFRFTFEGDTDPKVVTKLLRLGATPEQIR